MKNGSTVAAFEREFAQYVGAKYAIALCNGTATLHTALVALGVKPGDRVAVPPLTMSATTIAVLHAGAVPVFCDVDERTWLMDEERWPTHGNRYVLYSIPVSLYGLACPYTLAWSVTDAAQTLQRHDATPFTSYSFQNSKILALGEGGMLVTNDEELAIKAREFSSLGYRMRADQPRIDPAVLKSPTFDRHHSLGYNYRMSDLIAAEGLRQMRSTTVAVQMADGLFHELDRELPTLDANIAVRRRAAWDYRQAIAGCSWITPQHVPQGWNHDYWTFAVAVDAPRRAAALADAIVKHGGERPYPAWRLTYHEPAFRHLVQPTASFDSAEIGDPMAYRHGALPSGICPVAEDLQPRLLQFQTNDLVSAERNAHALRLAIHELGGSP